MQIYIWKSHENVYMKISWKWMHANLIKMCRYKSHEYVYMLISSKCIHVNLMKMDTSKSHGNGYK